MIIDAPFAILPPRRINWRLQEYRIQIPMDTIDGSIGRYLDMLSAELDDYNGWLGSRNMIIVQAIFHNLSDMINYVSAVYDRYE